MNKKIVVELTEAEAAVLHEHFGRNLSYRAGGSFGDGNDLDKKAYKIGLRVLEKITIAIHKHE